MPYRLGFSGSISRYDLLFCLLQALAAFTKELRNLFLSLLTFFEKVPSQPGYKTVMPLGSLEETNKRMIVHATSDLAGMFRLVLPIVRTPFYGWHLTP